MWCRKGQEEHFENLIEIDTTPRWDRKDNFGVMMLMRIWWVFRRFWRIWRNNEVLGVSFCLLMDNRLARMRNRCRKIAMNFEMNETKGECWEFEDWRNRRENTRNSNGRFRRSSSQCARKASITPCFRFKTLRRSNERRLISEILSKRKGYQFAKRWRRCRWRELLFSLSFVSSRLFRVKQFSEGFSFLSTFSCVCFFFFSFLIFWIKNSAHVFNLINEGEIDGGKCSTFWKIYEFPVCLAFGLVCLSRQTVASRYDAS